MKVTEIEISYKKGIKDSTAITDSKSAYKVLIQNWNLNQIEILEEFFLVMLNNSNQLIGIYPLSKGGRSSTIVDTKILFSVALKCNSTCIVIAHNHPSGVLKPSNSDKQLTNRIKQAGELLELKILDHLIITRTSYFSFADNGLL
jgi:DNA repair protein RadC